MASCSSPCFISQETIEIPCGWQSSSECGVNNNDFSCFHWWKALDDLLLTSLIECASVRNKDVILAKFQSKDELLKTINRVSVETAKSYIELRGLQMRSKVLNANIESQNEILTINAGLSNRGFFNLIEENEDLNNLNSLLVQKSSIELSIKKLIFHLSTLLGYPPGVLNDTLCQSQALPELCCTIPVGFPLDLICRNPTVQEVKKEYAATRNAQSFHHYQKIILDSLENAENSLATFNHARDKIHYLEKSKQLKNESYKLIDDLYNQGFKDDRDLLMAHQELLSEEDALIQGKVELLISYVNLYYALGGAWEVCCNYCK